MSGSRAGKAGGKAAGEDKVTPPADEPKKLADLSQEELRAAIEAGEIDVLTKEQIKKSDDLVEEYFYAEEWGGVVKIRGFSKGQQIEIDEQAMVDGEIDMQKLMMFSFLEGVVQPQFTLKDQEWLKEKNASLFDRIFVRISELSALGRKAQKDAEARFRDGSG